MKARVIAVGVLLGGCVAGVALWNAMPVRGAEGAASAEIAVGNGKGWDRALAAKYLDAREVWWQQWPRAQKDNGTICISCHTVLPYAMARGGLRRDLRETEMSAPEKVMLASVEKRVGEWRQMATFYSDEKTGPGKTAESRATEAVLNAVILASADARMGVLRPITRTAFENAWALQETTGDLAGGWKWQLFHLGPWESSYSGYQGAALLMVMAGKLPGGFAAEPETRAHLEKVGEFLRRGYAAQPLLNQMYVLWASGQSTSGKMPELLTPVEKKTLLAAMENAEQVDGGWRIASLVKTERLDGTLDAMDSDGYATGLAVLALRGAGVSRNDLVLRRGVIWLETHQQENGALAGSWAAMSINRKRDPKSDAYLFMTDAATGYAVMALEAAK